MNINIDKLTWLNLTYHTFFFGASGRARWWEKGRLGYVRSANISSHRFQGFVVKIIKNVCKYVFKGAYSLSPIFLNFCIPKFLEDYFNFCLWVEF